MIKIGVAGAGHLGKIHLRQLMEIPEFELVGFYDKDTANAEKVSAELGIKAFASLDELLEKVEALDIVTPTSDHFQTASQALKMSKHVFVEKPLTATIEEGEQLVKLSYEANRKVQVGHVERFNPALLALAEYKLKPMFIETHRLSEFNPRGTDVSVVHDLMIHDIDVTLSLIKSNVKNIHASGVAVVSEAPDIANARIEFDNGAVANLTASRISMKKMRKTRLFQKDAYITIDFLAKKAEVFKLDEIDEKPENPFALVMDLGEGKKKKLITFDAPEIPEVNSIRHELAAFASAIRDNTATAVSIEEGLMAMKIAHRILQKINSGNNIR